jgi:hypothetical protein
MDFLFHVPFFCTAAAVVTEILAVCFKIVEGKKLILNQVLISSKYYLSCAKTAGINSTRRKQAMFINGSLFYSHCAW